MIKISEAQIIAVIISYILGIFIVPIVISYSQKAGLWDKPNERKIHHDHISRLGGIAIWLSSMLTFLFLVLLSYYPSGVGLSGIIVGSSLMFLLGLIDDIYGLNAKFKLLIQLLIATMVILLGVRIDNIFNPFGEPISLGFWSYPVSLLWIVGISNAINFIDGIDGLAGSVITISCATLGVIALVMTPAAPISALIAAILLGSMLAFLTFNYNPAKIFMGDSGSLFAGFLLATLSITGVMKTAAFAMIIPFFILAVPILDMTYSSMRRILKGTSPFTADSSHIHHQLLKAGCSQNKTVVILTSLAIAFGAIAIVIVGTHQHYFFFTIIIALILIVLSLISRFILRRK